MSPGPAVPASARGLLSLLVACAVALALGLVTPGWVAARADGTGAGPATASTGTATDEALLQVRLDAVTPAIAGPAADVLVSGTLTNAGTGPARVHSVRVSTALRGLDTREAVDAWSTEGALDTPVLLAEDHISAALAPGAVVGFYARVPAGDLDPGFDFATLPLRIEVTRPVLGATGWPADGDGDDGTDEATGTDPAAVPGEVLPDTELRTFLPWQAVGADTFNPIDLAWVAPLTLPGGAELVDPDDAVRAQAWTAAIGPDSANVALLAGLSGTGTTFVVDPAVLEPLDPVASLTEAVQLPAEPSEPDGETSDPTSEPTDEATATAPTGEVPDGAAGEDGDEPVTGAPTQPGDSGPDGQSTPAPGDAATPSADTSDATATTPGPPTEQPEPVETPTPPTTEAAVLGLSALLAPIPADQLWWLPVGDTDTAALLELDTGAVDVAALVGRPAAGPLVTDGRTDIAWPVSADLDDSTVETLAEVWRLAGGATGAAGLRNGSLAGVVLPTSGIEGEALTGSAVRTHVSGTRLLGYDAPLSGVVAAAGSPDQDGRSVQRFLAETMAVYQQRPAVDRSLVVAIPRGAQLDARTLQALTSAADAAPWLAGTTAGELLDGPVDPSPATVLPPPPAEDAAAGETPVDGAASGARGDAGVPAPGDLTAYTAPGRSPLTARRVAAVEEAREALVGASEIVPGSEEARATWQRALDRQYSARWRQGTAGWSASVERVDNLSEEVLSGLTINPTTINFFADEGLIRITVTNELPIQIDDLQMTVSPGNARLRILAQPEPITIGPESRATVQFRARAVAAGEVPLNTSLSTPNGTPVGEQAQTSVRVRPAGVWIYWLLGGVAGVILVLGLVRALRPRSPSSPSEKKVAPAGPDTESP